MLFPSSAGLLLLLPAFALAQISPGPAPSSNQQHLSLDEALALAERYNPQMTVASARVEASIAGIQTAGARPNPDFSFLAGHQFARAVPNPAVPGTLQHYSVSQLVELPSVRRTRIGIAERTREVSEIGVQGTRLGLRAQLKHAFFEVLRREEEISHAQENLQLVVDLRNRTQVQVNVGEAAKLELTRAEAEIARAQTSVRSAQLLYVGAVSALRAIINAPPSTEIKPQGSLDPEINLPALEALRREVLQSHPAALQAQLEIDRAAAVLEHEKALRKPQPSLFAEYEFQPDLQFYRFGVTLPVPILNKRKGPIAEAIAELKAARAVAEERRLELTAALERAYGQYRIANEQVQSFAGGALREAESALSGAQAAFRFGERGIIDVLDAQRVLHEVRGDLLDAQYQRQAALIDLEELGAVPGKGRN